MFQPLPERGPGPSCRSKRGRTSFAPLRRSPAALGTALPSPPSTALLPGQPRQGQRRFSRFQAGAARSPAPAAPAAAAAPGAAGTGRA